MSDNKGNDNKGKGNMDFRHVTSSSSSSSSPLVDHVEGNAIASSFTLRKKEQRIYNKFTNIDAAITLVMISHNIKGGDEKEESNDQDYDEKEEMSAVVKGNSRHVCCKCGMVFKSYQAFGGHKAGHTKRTNGAAKTANIAKRISRRRE